MEFSSFPFSITDFASIEPAIYQGITGTASWKTLYRDAVRIRLVTYSPDYRADHWCRKGHIIFCLQGSMETELEDGSKHMLHEGMMYTVGDNSGEHRTYSSNGCLLFIVD